MNNIKKTGDRTGVDGGPASSKAKVILWTGTVVVAVLAVSFLLYISKVSSVASSVVVPTPSSVGIDDLGWKRGWSSSETGGPSRISMPEGRWMVLDDYKAVVHVAKAVKTRLQCLFVMCEFDRSNICAEYPVATQQGVLWDNSDLVSDDDFTIMNYVKDNSAYIEFGMHGVAHEHWENGVKTRAEFANDDKPWPWKDVWGQMECFKRLIDQYGISFPKSFVPPAHRYYYNPDDANDTGGLMHSWGIKYAVANETYLTDHGLMMLPRRMDVHYADIGTVPSNINPWYYYDWAHWSNLVETDPANNHIAGDKWIGWFERIKEMPDRYVPKNTAQLFSQYLYQHFSTIRIHSHSVKIDNREMPDWAYELDLLGNLVLKLVLEEGTHVSSARLNTESIACYYEENGYGYIVLPRLGKSVYELTYQTGATEIPDYVLNDGTYNIERFEAKEDSATVSLEMYGTQDVKVKLSLFEPVEAVSDNPSLVINSFGWNEVNNTFVMNMTASDVQGVNGDVKILGVGASDKR